MSSPSPSNNIPPYPQGPPAGRRASKRSKLRVGTFIEPSTGERSRRTFTLRLPLRRRSVQASLNGNGASASTVILPVFSDQEQSLSERSRAAAHNLRAGVVRGFQWLNSPTGRGVLKCTLAYTIASLATFLAPISDFLGKPDGKHVVATITVYFHPARSAGSMIEAILIAIVAVAYAQVVSILSMCTSVLFGNVWGNPALAHVLVLVVFIGGGFGFIGWLKQRMNNPLVNVGSTLASLAIIGVVTKESAVLTGVFSNQKIIQILKMLVMGITITTLVNLLVWRVSAVHLLRKSMTQTSAALGDMLAMITHGFLSGAEDELLSREFNAASAAYKSVYPQLTKNLREAKFERYFLGQEKIYQLDRAVVKSMETLAQSIGGLRSAANTQFALLKESFEQADQPPLSPRMQRTASTILKSGKDRSSVLQAIREASDEGDDDGVLPGNRRRSDVSIAPSFRNSGEIFELFIALLGPSMKSLAYTLSEVLRDPPFGSAPNYEILINDQFRQSLTDALGLFNDARAKALHELYKYLEMDRTRSEQIQADFEEVAAACGHFSFSLQSFAEEMQKYLDVLDDLKHESQFKRRSWHWFIWWRSKDHHSRFFPALPYNQVPEEQEGLIKPIKKTAIPKGIPDSLVQRRDTYNWEAAKDQSSRVVATLSQKLLRLMRRLARDDVRFGLKVGIGAILWAMFAFIPQTRDTYQHWRGEWGFLSFMIVCSMTVGAANTTGWARFLGTMIGAGAAYVNWNVTHGNALGLIVLGWLMAFWSFWIMIARGQAPLGRITLLAYNVSTLYAYSLSQKVDDDDDDEGGSHPIIGEIVRHRFIAVTAGILWGLIVCRVIWPISARKKFHQGLSMLYLQMGLIWKRGPLAILLRSDCSRSYLKSGEMTALKKYAARLDALRASAVSEFQLRGPFPAAQAGRLMQCASRLLDAFYAMSLVTQRRGHLTEGERALLLYTAEERKALCDRICHVFQVLASSLMLEYPLTDAIPSVLGQRDKLLAKIFLFRKEHMPSRTLQNLNTDRDKDRAPESPTAAVAGRANSYVTAASSLSFSPTTSFGQNTAGNNGSWNNSLRGSIDESLDFKENNNNTNNPSSLLMTHGTVVEERDYALLYAYALVTGQVAEELSEVAKEIEGLFGVLDKESILLQ